MSMAYCQSGDEAIKAGSTVASVPFSVFAKYQSLSKSLPLTIEPLLLSTVESAYIRSLSSNPHINIIYI